MSVTYTVVYKLAIFGLSMKPGTKRNQLGCVLLLKLLLKLMF